MDETIHLETNQDAIWKNYLQDNEIFIDLINGILFQGKQVVKSCMINNWNTDSSTVFDFGKLIKSFQKNRDAIRLWNGPFPLFISIENQSTIDYTMPFRVMSYDVINYNQQYSLLDKNQKKSFQPIPIYTLILYHGESNWVSPHTLKEKMKIPKEFESKVNDWHIDVVDIKTLKPELFRHKFNQKLIEAVNAYYDWKEHLSTIPQLSLPREVAIVVATIINCPFLINYIEENPKEEIDMCIALQLFEKRAERRGIEQGIEQGIEEGIKQTNREIIQNMLKKGLSVKQIEEYTDIPYNTIQQIISYSC